MASDDKTCLFLGPFAAPGSDIQAYTEDLCRQIIQPALETRGISLGFQTFDAIPSAGSISERIVETLYSAYLAIADLTYPTPNIMFEIGYRLALNLPLIAIVQKDHVDTLPFDVKTLNVVAYSLETEEDRKRAIRNVRTRIRRILKGEQKDTIFSEALKDLEKRRTATNIYLSFIESLRHAQNSMNVCVSEFKLETLFSVEILKEHHASLHRIFTTLSDKLYIYTQIARGTSIEYTDSGLLDLIAQAGRAVDMGDRASRCVLKAVRQIAKTPSEETNSIIRTCLTEVIRILAKAELILSRVIADTEKLVQPRKDTEQTVEFSEVLHFLEAQGYRLTSIMAPYRVFTKESRETLPLLVPVKHNEVSQDYFRLLRKNLENAIK